MVGDNWYMFFFLLLQDDAELFAHPSVCLLRLNRLWKGKIDPWKGANLFVQVIWQEDTVISRILSESFSTKCTISQRLDILKVSRGCEWRNVLCCSYYVCQIPFRIYKYTEYWLSVQRCKSCFCAWFTYEWRILALPACLPICQKTPIILLRLGTQWDRRSARPQWSLTSWTESSLSDAGSAAICPLLTAWVSNL